MMRLIELLLCAGLACVFFAAGVLALTSANIALVSPLLAGIGLTLVFLLDQLCSLNRAVVSQTDYLHEQYQHQQKQRATQLEHQVVVTPTVAEAVAEPAPMKQPMESRQWTYEGRKPFDGTYVSVTDGVLVVLLRDGRTVSGDISKFSKDDKWWVATEVQDPIL